MKKLSQIMIESLEDTVGKENALKILNDLAEKADQMELEEVEMVFDKIQELENK